MVISATTDFFQRKWLLEDYRGLAICRVNFPLMEKKMSLLRE